MWRTRADTESSADRQFGTSSEVLDFTSSHGVCSLIRLPNNYVANVLVMVSYGYIPRRSGALDKN